MTIPFTKAHGAQNDFLLTWGRDAPGGGYPALARAICDRHTGVGADGWMLVDPPQDGQAEGAIRAVQLRRQRRPKSRATERAARPRC